MERVDLDSRDRVPAHRGDARRAEGPAPAARAATTSSSTRSCCASRSATSCSRACSSARRSRTRRRCCTRGSPRRGRTVARTRGSRGAVPLAGARSARAHVARRVPRGGAARARAEAVEPEVRTDHVAPIRASVRDAIETVLALLPDDAARCASATSRSACRREARGHRAVPRGARAVQAGRRSTSNRSRASASSSCARSPPGERVALDLVVARGVGRRRPSPATPIEAQRDRASRASRSRCERRRDRRRSRGARSKRWCWRRPSRCHPTVLAQLVELPTTRSRSCATSSRPSTSARAAGSSSRASRAATASRPTPTRTPYVERFVLEGQTARLSGPALETLAIVAYKQPISRAQLSAIRGVNVDATLKTLVARGYVEEIGHEHDAGQPGAVRHDAAVPRTARSRLARRAAGARRLRARGVDRRGARTRAALPPAEATSRSPDRARRRAEAQSRRDRPHRHDGSERRASACRRCSRAPGFGSRRTCEVLIAAGRVTVDGEVAVLGAASTRDARHVALDGVPVVVDTTLVHWLLNKPAGYVTTAQRSAGPAHGARSRARRAARVPGRAARPRHRRPADAHERRRARAAAHAPEPRRREGVPRRGRGRARRRRRCARCAKASSSTTARRVRRACGSCRSRPTARARSRSWSRKVASGWCGACARRSVIRCGGWCARASARCATRSSRRVRGGRSTPTRCGRCTPPHSASAETAAE